MDGLFYLVPIGTVVGACLLYHLLRCPRAEEKRRLPRQAAQRAPQDGEILWEHPLLCHHRGCRQTGEVFWQSRHGTVILCRAHALQLRQRLEEALEKLGPDHP